MRGNGIIAYGVEIAAAAKTYVASQGLTAAGCGSRSDIRFGEEDQKLPPAWSTRFTRISTQ